MKDLEWFGHAGHFIGSADCLWHLCTRVGDYLISSVGDYRPMDATKPQELGYKRLYETFVFRLGEKPHRRCSCGCGSVKPADLSEIDSRSANDAIEATKNHLEMCRLYEDGLPVPSQREQEGK